MLIRGSVGEVQGRIAELWLDTVGPCRGRMGRGMSSPKSCSFDESYSAFDGTLLCSVTTLSAGTTVVEYEEDHAQADSFVTSTTYSDLVLPGLTVGMDQC